MPFSNLFEEQNKLFYKNEKISLPSFQLHYRSIIFQRIL